jgi:hypothetical protein
MSSLARSEMDTIRAGRENLIPVAKGSSLSWKCDCAHTDGESLTYSPVWVIHLSTGADTQQRMYTVKFGHRHGAHLSKRTFGPQ